MSLSALRESVKSFINDHKVFLGKPILEVVLEKNNIRRVVYLLNFDLKNLDSFDDCISEYIVLSKKTSSNQDELFNMEKPEVGSISSLRSRIVDYKDFENSNGNEKKREQLILNTTWVIQTSIKNINGQSQKGYFTMLFCYPMIDPPPQTAPECHSIEKSIKHSHNYLKNLKDQGNWDVDYDHFKVAVVLEPNKTIRYSDSDIDVGTEISELVKKIEGLEKHNI